MFKGIAVKALSSVEIDHLQSNQHEFHGVTELKKIFGYDRQCFEGEFYYVEQSGKIVKDANVGELTWYDARENVMHRSPEYRLYYTNNIAVNRANAGDVLLVALSDNNVVKVIVIEKGTQFIDVIRNALELTTIKDKYYFVENIELIEGIFELFK